MIKLHILHRWVSIGTFLTEGREMTRQRCHSCSKTRVTWIPASHTR